ncbi:MAG: hypothetical protein QM528_03445 [Phycisphaerales bacterium]|nr:hypothetical protein [Phycisphaerales bacterium]
MLSLEQALLKFLSINEQLLIPNVGLLTLSWSSSEIVGSSIIPPLPQLQIRPQSFTLADRYFYGFIAKEMNITQMQAIFAFQELSRNIETELAQNGFSVVDKICVLQKNDANEIGIKEVLIHSNLPNLQINSDDNNTVEVLPELELDESATETNNYLIFVIIGVAILVICIGIVLLFHFKVLH